MGRGSYTICALDLLSGQNNWRFLVKRSWHLLYNALPIVKATIEFGLSSGQKVRKFFYIVTLTAHYYTIGLNIKQFLKEFEKCGNKKREKEKSEPSRITHEGTTIKQK